MIFTSILSLVSSVFTNVLLFFAGKLLINNRRFLLYLGIKAQEDIAQVDMQNGEGLTSTSIIREEPSFKDNKAAIEGILTTIGLLIQIIAIISIVTEVTVTILGISRLVETTVQNSPSIHNTY